MDSRVFCSVQDVSLLVCGEGREWLAPIAPVCQVLGIDDREQADILGKSSMFSSKIFVQNILRNSWDKNPEPMVCLPIDYILGWIMSVDLNKSTRNNPEHLREVCYRVFADIWGDMLKDSPSTFEEEIALLEEQVEALKSISYHEGEIKRLKSRLSEIDQEIYNVRKKRHQVLEVSDD